MAKIPTTVEYIVDVETPLTIEIVSDVVCPWCFIGLRRLELAIKMLRERHPDFRYQKRWWPFFLNADSPSDDEPYLPFLIRKFGSREQVAAIWARVRSAGLPLGIDFQFEKITVRANTLQAHRLIHWAQQQGDADPLVERLFIGQFERGENVADLQVLTRAAEDCGYDQKAVAAYLASPEDADMVRTMEAEAREWGVNAVPTFIFDRKFAIQGAEDPATLADGIERVLVSSRTA